MGTHTALSKDGTPIAYERSGSGPALILVDGALCYRKFGPMPKLVPLLTPHFTVITYDRRGRGESGDTKPYAVEREVEDLEALIREAGGSAFVYGISSGAALALEAAAHQLNIRKLALYEAPFIVDDTRSPLGADYVASMNRHIAADERGAALTQFMKAVGAPGFAIFMMRLMPAWSKLKAVAHTLPYDTAIVSENQRGKPLPARRWESVTSPTLVADGGKSPAWLRNGMKSLAELLPNATYQTLPGQTHMLKPEAIAPVLVDFFKNPN
jgi:pimeloyl-ACP methyl ester carboxylesterase